MKLTVFLLAVIPLAAAPRTTLPFDSGWRFLNAPGHVPQRRGPR
jgi:hypothetical protein